MRRSPSPATNGERFSKDSEPPRAPEPSPFFRNPENKSRRQESLGDLDIGVMTGRFPIKGSLQKFNFIQSMSFPTPYFISYTTVRVT